jgi:hypothetical protein
MCRSWKRRTAVTAARRNRSSRRRPPPAGAANPCSTLVGAGCGSGPRPRKVGASHPAGSQRPLLFLRSVLRIRDAVQWWCLPGPLKPRKRARPPIKDGRRSAAREAVLRNTLASPLAAVSLAIPGQTAPSRHHHCPAHFAAEPLRVRTPPDPQGRGSLEFSKERRDRVGPSRTVFGQGWPNVEPTGMYSWRVLDGPTRSRRGLSRGKSLWDPAGWLAPTFRGRGPLSQKHKKGPAMPALFHWRLVSSPLYSSGKISSSELSG